MKRLVLLVTVLLSLAVPASVYAFNPLGNACGAGGNVQSDSAACSADPTKDPIAGPNGVLKKASIILSILAGIAAVVLIIISGFRYVMSAGDAQKAASARSGIIGAVVGLVIVAVAETVIIFVVNKIG